jgi:hypothetical protein
MLDGINTFHHLPAPLLPVGKEKQPSRIGLQVDGGRWALTAGIPPHGAVYGALRVPKARWAPTPGLVARETLLTVDYSMFEICYSISHLDGEWGDFTRLMLVGSRFVVRNDSTIFVFEIKQTGADDSTAKTIGPGETVPFHWSDFRLPGLICVRPIVANVIYRWTGGFDPLTIGATPLRVRHTKSRRTDSYGSANWVRSLKLETEIRPRTGGTGITISLQEEDESGFGALFRLENQSPFPIWISQDGILANHPSGDGRGYEEIEGDIVEPSKSLSFALDVPFRQGKYAKRKAATMTELLRARLALAPLSSRAGIETTKVISMTSIGERIRLNPSKLTIYEAEMRHMLRLVRVIGLLINDGPTRVLRFW